MMALRAMLALALGETLTFAKASAAAPTISDFF
jgi:hypothetical protein